MGDELRAAALRQGQITLKSLSERVNTLHEEAVQHCKAGLLRAKEIGQLLSEAKASIKHGAFEAWVNHECDFSSETARRYMRIYERWDELIEEEGPGRMSQMTLSEGIRKLAQKCGPKESEPPPKRSHVTDFPQAGGCIKGGDHVWEEDPELEGEFCHKCHEKRPASGGKTSDGDAEGYTWTGEQGPEEEASAGMAEERLLELCELIETQLPKLADAIAEIAKNSQDETLGNILDALRVAYSDLAQWRKRNGL